MVVVLPLTTQVYPEFKLWRVSVPARDRLKRCHARWWSTSRVALDRSRIGDGPAHDALTARRARGRRAKSARRAGDVLEVRVERGLLELAVRREGAKPDDADERRHLLGRRDVSNGDGDAERDDRRLRRGADRRYRGVDSWLFVELSRSSGGPRDRTSSFGRRRW